MKNKNEMEKAKNTMGPAQELSLDALQGVSGGRVEERIEDEERKNVKVRWSGDGPWDRGGSFIGDVILKRKKYDVVDEGTNMVVKSFDDGNEANICDDMWHHRG